MTSDDHVLQDSNPAISIEFPCSGWFRRQAGMRWLNRCFWLIFPLEWKLGQELQQLFEPSDIIAAAAFTAIQALALIGTSYLLTWAWNKNEDKIASIKLLDADQKKTRISKLDPRMMSGAVTTLWLVTDTIWVISAWLSQFCYTDESSPIDGFFGLLKYFNEGITPRWAAGDVDFTGLLFSGFGHACLALALMRLVQNFPTSMRQDLKLFNLRSTPWPFVLLIYVLVNASLGALFRWH